MNNFLKQILIDSEYANQIYNDIEFFCNDYEYFIIERFDSEEFKNFFKSDKLDNLILKFQLLKNVKIKKNTSLFILVKVDNLQEYYNLHINSIMDIEEDEYYFRKYVILYTEKGVIKLNSNLKSILEYIEDLDSECNRLFDRFENNMFFEDAYFIAMQVIIKLPFVSLPHASKSFEMIEERIKIKIEKENAIESEKITNQILHKFRNTDINEQINDDTNILNELNEILGD